MSVEKYIYNKSINNISDLISLYNDHYLDNILVNNDKLIKVDSLLIKNSILIHLNQQIIFNIDNYISYIKSLLNINQLEIRYIISLTLNNKYNYIFRSNKYYPDYIDIYHRIFKKIFLYNYNFNKNILIANNIKIHSFNNLINIINNNKKRSFVYFEKIDEQNFSLNINILKQIESKK